MSIDAVKRLAAHRAAMQSGRHSESPYWEPKADRGYLHQLDEDREALAYAFIDHIDNETTEMSRRAGIEPWMWLANPVSDDGEGYILVSASGAWTRISNAQRQFMADACKESHLRAPLTNAPHPAQ